MWKKFNHFLSDSFFAAHSFRHFFVLLTIIEESVVVSIATACVLQLHFLVRCDDFVVQTAKIKVCACNRLIVINIEICWNFVGFLVFVTIGKVLEIFNGLMAQFVDFTQRLGLDIFKF